MARCITDTNALHDPAERADAGEDAQLADETIAALRVVRRAVDALRSTLRTERWASAWHAVASIEEEVDAVSDAALEDEAEALRRAARDAETDVDGDF